MSTPSDPRTERLRRFRNRAYGLFLHYGLYSLRERGEWTLHHHRSDPSEYQGLMEQFTADRFDAPALAKWAVAQGFRYICLTSRHHDGFSLYDTRGLNRYDAPHSAAGRDLIAEFTEACRNQGLGVYLYHTTLDWADARFDRDWKGYLAYLRDSIRILCSHYGRIDGFWFDGNWSRRERDWEEDALYGLIRELQPKAIIVNNSSIGRPGERGHPELDVVTFEQHAPSSTAEEEVGGEMCQTLTSHWGHAAADYSHKSPSDLIRDLLVCRAAGTNLLLNTGPRPDGSLDPLDKALLEKVGDWCARTLGNALYESEPVAAAQADGEDLLLKTGNRLLYAAFSLPIDKNTHLHEGRRDWAQRSVAGKIPPLRSVRWLDNGEELPFVQDTEAELLAFRASPCPYGSQFVARVAELLPQ
mgnify:CR=1 FL=1